MGTVCLEAVLPVLLLPATGGLAMGLGTVLHLAFMALFPKRLLPFSLATVASSLAFLDPNAVAG